jgi:methyl-accepting chemotaxis protein
VLILYHLRLIDVHPDDAALTTISDTLRIVQTDAKTKTESTAHAFGEIKNEPKNTAEIVQHSAANVQQNVNTAKEARAAAKEAIEVGETTLEITREMKNKRSQE